MYADDMRRAAPLWLEYTEKMRDCPYGAEVWNHTGASNSFLLGRGVHLMNEGLVSSQAVVFTWDCGAPSHRRRLRHLGKSEAVDQ
eukprot:scaffold985_cov573-Prasinococcus_capsulatus_cf.AAC.6